MRALDPQTLSTTATCFQCDGDGRRAGLKIRWCADEEFEMDIQPFNARWPSPPTARTAVPSSMSRP